MEGGAKGPGLALQRPLDGMVACQVELLYMGSMSNARNILFRPAAFSLPLALGRLLLSCP